MAEDKDNFLGMSDEDFLGTDTSEFDNAFLDAGDEASAEEELEEEAPAPDEVGGDVADDDNDDDSEDAGAAGDDDQKDDQADGDDPAGDSTDSDRDSDTDGADGNDDGSESADGDSKPEVTEPKAQDHKNFFEKVTGEFKANGKMMKVDTPEDVVRLMQMGANYNRKMAALKPSMKVLKVLEKNGLLDESKLGFLLDLNQKNPKAIAKLLADSGIDPLDLDLAQGAEYQASDYSVDDREIALDTVVEELKESPTYTKTINLVTQKWDGASKQIVANEPELLKVLDSHMANGVYDLISTEVEKERVFGRLDGMSDIEAYRTVGDAIAQRGGFAHLTPSPGQGQQSTPNAGKNATPTPDDGKQARRDKRRAASPSKATAPAGKADSDFNPLGMSDEDYLKQFDSKYL